MPRGTIISSAHYRKRDHSLEIKRRIEWARILSKVFKSHDRCFGTKIRLLRYHVFPVLLLWTRDLDTNRVSFEMWLYRRMLWKFHGQIVLLRKSIGKDGKKEGMTIKARKLEYTGHVWRGIANDTKYYSGLRYKETMIEDNRSVGRRKRISRSMNLRDWYNKTANDLFHSTGTTLLIRYPTSETDRNSS